MQLKSLFVAVALMAASFTVSAGDQATAEKAIQAQLNQLIPNAPKADIIESVIPGLYQVSIGPKVVYMSADGKHLVDGAIVDLATRNNLTEAAENAARQKALAELDAASMVVYPAKGKAEHVVTVFTDVDCPYCHKLHKEVPKLNEAGIEVRYMAYPRAGMGSPSYYKTVAAWCADDPKTALDKAMAGETIPKTACKNSVSEHMAQAQLFGVNGTPNLILDNGQMIPGYVPAPKLIAALKASKK